eukprot:3187095-Pyramimonas_sp.AAC.1
MIELTAPPRIDSNSSSRSSSSRARPRRKAKVKADAAVTMQTLLVSLLRTRLQHRHPQDRVRRHHR